MIDAFIQSCSDSQNYLKIPDCILTLDYENAEKYNVPFRYFIFFDDYKDNLIEKDCEYIYDDIISDYKEVKLCINENL